MSIRRVVTGNDGSGASIFVSDGGVDPLKVDYFPGWKFFNMWGGDFTPSFPGPGDQPSMATYFPAVDGFRFAFSVVPPAGTRAMERLDVEAAQTEVEAALPGLLSYMEVDGYHTTDTNDFEVILRGSVILGMDNGVEKVLHPGDTVVQNGTRHYWRNDGTEPVLMAVFMVGAHRRTK
jgi:mannose-6-phosphate isomerase-like protein (cupin superfamily)